MTERQTVGVVRATTFKFMLLVMGLCCLVGVVANMHDHFEMAHAVPATISLDSTLEQLPADWGSENRAAFEVKVHAADGADSRQELYLARPVIESLLAGGSAEIVFVRDNPRRFQMQGDPLPPLGLGWLAGGLAFFGVFWFSLRLR